MRRHHYLIPISIGVITLGSFRPAEGQQKTPPPPEFVNWLPVSDAERDLKTPRVDKDAGAEILLWRVHVVDELLSNEDLQRVFYHYVRLKVFNEKGREATSTIDLTYRTPGAILEVAGRTIKPDQTVLELDRKTVYKRDLIRAGRASEKAVSFAMPAVEPGSIVEYRWKQTEDDNRFKYVRLHFQRDFPVERVTYYVKRLSNEVTRADMYLLPFNCAPSPIKLENDGYSSTTLTNVPASRHEPYAPSDPNLEAWALLFYRDSGSKDPDKYWNAEGKKAYREVKDLVKSSDELKAAATEAVSGLAQDEDKVTALVTALHKKLRNLFDSEVTEAERVKFFERLVRGRDRNSAEIFKSGIATSSEMNVVFAALAMEAGLEARPALIASRDEYIFNPKFADRYFLDNTGIAVKLSSTWKVVDASRKLLTPGMLPWQEDGMMALITDPKTPTFVQIPASPPESSAERRTAQLRLSDIGTLSGDVDESYTGHRAEGLREEIKGKSPAQRDDWLRDRVVQMFPDAEVTAIDLQNADDARKPLTARYHLDAPRYAQVTGKRILFQPNAFRRGKGSPFSASERRFPVDFPYGWQEVDEVHIRLPEGFSLDNADNPGGLDFGEPGSYRLQMGITKGAEPEFQMHREFTFGNKGLLLFQAESYATLKRIFDSIQVRDTHTISLKGN